MILTKTEPFTPEEVQQLTEEFDLKLLPAREPKDGGYCPLCIGPWSFI